MVADFFKILGDHQVINSLLSAILRAAYDLDQFFFCPAEQFVNDIIVTLYLLSQARRSPFTKASRLVLTIFFAAVAICCKSVVS